MDIDLATPESEPQVIVGRDREREALRQRLDDAISGQGKIVLISGAAGIGKTTLATWLATTAAERGLPVLRGGCYDLSTTPPYGPWIEVFRRWAATPSLQPLPAPLSSAWSPADLGSQAALFELVATTLKDASATVPLAIVLEDLHWADQASLDVLRFVARRLGDSRSLIIGTYRDDELTRHHPLSVMLPLLVRESAASRITLAPLDADDIAALVAARYTLPDAQSAALTRYVGQLSEGNPFFAVEILHALEANRTLQQTPAGWQLRELDQIQVPALVRQVIDSRLDRLGADARHLLEIASVIGHEVAFDIWLAAGAVSEDTLLDVVERAITAHVLVEMPDGAQVRFTHALVRETLYTGIISLRRRRWHRAIADVLAELSQPDPDAVAMHYQQTGDARAIDWLIRAGERAQLSYAWPIAIDRYEAALQLLQRTSRQHAQRGWLLYRIARLQRFDDPVTGLAYLDDALRLAVEHHDLALEAAVRFSRGVCAFYAGDVPTGLHDMAAGADMLEALPIAEQQRLDLGPTPDGVPTITNPRGWLVATLAISGDLDTAVRVGEATTEGRPPLTALSELGSSHYGDRYVGLGMAYAMLGRVDAAWGAFDTASALFGASGHFATQGATTFQALKLVALPYWTEQRHLQEQLVVRTTDAWARADGHTDNWRGPASAPVAYLQGKWDVARSEAETILAPLPSSSDSVIIGSCRLILGWISRECEAVQEAWQQVVALLPNGPATEPGSEVIDDAIGMQRLAIALALDAEDLPLAQAWLASNERWLTWSGCVLGRSDYTTQLAAYQRATGDHSNALKHARLAVEQAQHPRQPLALIAAHRLLGCLLTEQATYDEALESLQEAIEIATRCQVPYERALTLIELARLHVALRQHRDAVNLLAEARAICEPLGATLSLRRVASIETSLASSPRPPYPAGLSVREVEVLRLVAQGLTDAEVAQQLFLSRRTVGQHLRNIYNKLGVGSRMAAARFAIDHDLT